MRATQAARIRYAVLLAREKFEPARMTRWQDSFQWAYGEPKSWLLDGKLENRAYEREALRAYLRIRRAA